MTDHLATRPPRYAGGIPVRLADGRSWCLAPPSALDGDPQFDALLAGVEQADDQFERRRAELALAIFLLTRNYDLSAAELNSLLSFEHDAAGRDTFALSVHALARTLLVARRESGPALSVGSTRGEGLVRWLRALWPLGTS
ncbi:MAG: hypothetical protein U0794_09170 [Isosphaeraceae bacterium]